jgi:hypothetical protein
MEIGDISFNDNIAVDVDTIRNTLMDELDKIDTSIEIGKETTLSDDFINTM